MKKTIMFVLIVILLVIAYFLIFQSLSIGNFTIQSIEGIKKLDEDLNSEITIATEKTAKTYPSEVQNLNVASKNLVMAKKEYEKINKSGELGVIQVKTYKIEYLWTKLGNYAKNRNVKATFDLNKTNTDNLYDINFTLKGDYEDIVNYLSDIENDDSFSFKITEFQLVPYTKIYTSDIKKFQTNTNSEETTESTETKQNTSQTIVELPYEETKTNTETEDSTVASEYDPINLVATFKVKNVGIELD